jgi:hypothetical protein
MSPTGAACSAPSATSSDNRRRPGRHAGALSDLLLLRMSPDEGCPAYSRFPKPVTASVRGTAATGQVMPSSRAIGTGYPDN